MTYIDELFDRIVFDEEDRTYHRELYSKMKSLCKEIEQRIHVSSSMQSEALHLAFKAFSLGLMHIGSALARADKYKEK